MENTIYLDLDDFSEDNNEFERLLELKEAVPNLKLNLFTIPSLCSFKFLKEIREVNWIRMYPHGKFHTTSRECQFWNYETSIEWLKALEDTYWTKVWRSPGWQTSDKLFKALVEREWIIADQFYNDNRRPKELRVYYLDSPNKIHGHIGHMGSHNDNALEYIFDDIVKLKDREFGFIDDIWN